MDIQYSLTGAPKNVPKNEYSRYTLIRALGGFFLPILGIGALVVGISGLTLRRAEQLAALPELRLDGEPQQPGRYRATGRLRSSAPVLMPDDASKVLRGSLSLLLKGRNQGENEARSFQDWSAAAASFELEQGGRRIPLRLDPEALPMIKDSKARAQLRFENPGARFKGKLMEAQYAGRVIEGLPKAWNALRDPRLQLRRTFCPDGIEVTFAATLEPGPALTGLDGPAKSFERGDLAAVRSRGETARPLLIGFGVLALLGAAACRPYLKRTRADFVQRSNA